MIFIIILYLLGVLFYFLYFFINFLLFSYLYILKKPPIIKKEDYICKICILDHRIIIKSLVS